jgi:hypothetical protein
MLPKIVVSVLGGLVAALLVLETATVVTWRTGVQAAIAFLGATGVPAAHGLLTTTTTNDATIAPPYLPPSTSTPAQAPAPVAPEAQSIG